MERIKVTVIHKPSENYFVVQWFDGGTTRWKHFCYLPNTTTEECKKDNVKEEALKYAKLVETGMVVNGEEIIYQTDLNPISD